MLFLALSCCFLAVSWLFVGSFWLFLAVLTSSGSLVFNRLLRTRGRSIHGSGTRRSNKRVGIAGCVQKVRALTTGPVMLVGITRRERRRRDGAFQLAEKGRVAEGRRPIEILGGHGNERPMSCKVLWN